MTKEQAMEQQLNEIKAALAGLAETVGKIGDVVKAQVAEATAPVLARIGDVESKVAAAPAAKGAGKDKGGADDAVDIASSPAIKALMEELGTIKATVGQFTAEKQTAEQTRQAEQRVDAVLAARFPGLGKSKALRNRLVAAAPKDEAAVLALINAEREYLQEVGGDTKPFTAAPVDEGGKPVKPKDEKSAKLEELGQMHEKKLNAPSAPVGAGVGA